MRWRAPRTGADAPRGASAAAAVVLVAAAACARQEAPPGAEVDRAPPRLESIRPEDGAVVPALDVPLTLRFDEPVDERRALERELVASPAYRYRVEFGFSTVEIEPSEGWRDGAVYHFRIPPPFTDLLGNRTEEAIDITFSTGPEISETRVEATVRDRVTGDRLQDARVLLYPAEGDSVPYTAARDTGDTYRLAALPPGRYRAWAFRDLNGNRRLERSLEAHDSTVLELGSPDATASLEFGVVEPDSTPPELGTVAARDSQLVELQFDDPLDPDQDFGAASVAVRDTATGRTWPVAGVGLTPARAGREPPASAGEDAPPDTAPAPDAVPPDTPAVLDAVPVGDTAPGDTAETAPGGAPPPDDAAGPGEGAGEPDAAAPDTAPLPSRTVLVRLGRPLEDGGVYRVRTGGVTNLRGLAGGGDTLLEYTAPADTGAAGQDTLPEDADADTAGGRP